MHKVNSTTGAPVARLRAGDIVRGSYGRGMYSGHFLLTPKGMVLLEDPNKTWDNPSRESFDPESVILSQGARVTITIGG